MSLRQKILFRMMNFWPPFWAAGIHIDRVSQDHFEIDVSLKLTFWNRNYVGTAYGGSLYSMCDPFFMLILIQQMGRGYIVWDKAASIKFKRPGTKKVFARFKITPEEVRDFKEQLKELPKIEPKFLVQIKDIEGNVIAEVEKVLHLRKKLIA